MKPLIHSLLVFVLLQPFSAKAQSKDQARQVMKKAATYYFENVSVNGGYVYFYSTDLKRRLGEGVASPTEIWVQPPGTPTVGMAYLKAWQATKDTYYLKAATAAGDALVFGQLQSGGWQNHIEFDSSSKRSDLYRNGKGTRKGRNNSSLDDNQTQSALRFLIQLDEALDFENASIHEAVEYGLAALLNAQFSNGAFPQVWNKPVPKDLPDKTGNFPAYDWRTEGRIKEYWNLYTLNDGLARDVFETLAEAHRVYKKQEVYQAIKRLGDFLIKAQMPSPQRGWAQQYNYEMQPVWARKFEPPAIAGAESQDIMLTLLKIYDFTNDQRYLRPVVDGVRYLRTSLLPDGRLARYYELETNRPLYMERKGDVYSLTNSDKNLPSHYGWKWDSKLKTIEDTYRIVSAGKPYPKPPPPSPGDIQEAIRSLDDEGRWLAVYDGERLVGQAKFAMKEKYLSSELFSENLSMLSEFISR